MHPEIPLFEPNDQLDLELADMKRVHALNLRLLNGGDLCALLMEVLKASADLLQTDKGNVQLYDEHQQALNFAAHLGFSPEFLDYFRSVPAGYSVCGTAMANRERIIMEDASTDPRFVEFAPVFEKFGFVAVQSTPLIGRDGRFLGMLSNHFKNPRRPDSREMQLLDLFAQQAVWVIERDRAEAALRESETRFRTLADSTPVLMWLTDQSGAVFVNQAYLDFLGLRDQQHVEGFHWASHIHPDDRNAYVERYLECAKTQSPFTAEFRFRRQDGEYRWMRTVALPRKDDQGHRHGYAGTTLDITETKEAQLHLERWARALELAVEDRTKELLRSQADLQALTVELTLTEQRERKRLATDLHDHLQQLLVLGKIKLGQGKQITEPPDTSSKVMHEVDAILSDALTYTRTLVAELSPPVLREQGLFAALRWLSQYMREHDMMVSVDIEQDAAIDFPEDEAVLLFQSVRELLINASKYADTDHATVRVQVRDGAVRIEVRDEGKGFDMAEPLAEEASTVSSKFGLASIRERMRALGGSFELSSSPGNGTCAALIVPASRKAARVLTPGTRSPTPRMRGQNPRKSAIRVLLADDHAIIREGLRSLLEGYRDIEIVGEAKDGIEVLAAVEQLRPALVIMDISMPRMNGIEATRRIRQRYADVNVIGLSVNTEHEIQKDMQEAGAYVLLNKETAVEQLYSSIQKLVETQV